MAPEKIGPTVGQNSKSPSLHPSLLSLLLDFRVKTYSMAGPGFSWIMVGIKLTWYSREDLPTVHDTPFLRFGWTEGYPVDMA